MTTAIFEGRDTLRAKFVARLRATKGYKGLTKIPVFDAAHAQRFEEQCWRLHCYSKEVELKGSRARQALASLRTFCTRIGDLVWLSDSSVNELNALAVCLEKLSATKSDGRASDQVARTFRRIMHIFLPISATSKWGRFLSREEADELLADVLALVTGRRISAESFARMRKRDRSMEQKLEAVRATNGRPSRKRYGARSSICRTVPSAPSAGDKIPE